MSPKRCLNDALRGNVGAQAHVREHIDSQDEVTSAVAVAGKNHPANPIAGNHVALREAAEGDAEQVGSHAGDRHMLFTVEHQAVINLIGEDHELVLASHIDYLLQHFARIQCACGIVGVDDDDGLGARCDFAFDVLNVGIPLRLFVANVVNGIASSKGCASCPKRVVGAWDKDLVAIIEKSLHAQVDKLAHAVTGVNAVHVHVGQAFDLRVLHDGLAGAEEPLRIAVAFAVG